MALLSRFALVTTDTSESLVDPSGSLVVVDIRSRTVVATHDLGGQPDSVTISPDGRYAAIAIENQRDEDLDDGILPQLPSGELLVVDLDGRPASWPIRRVDLTGLAPTDAEVEFVDINQRNQAVVTLQENNHIALVDLRRARVVGDFSAGEVTLAGVDATEEEVGPQERGLISFTETITKRREPDTVQWISSRLFATANEGDYTDADGEEGGAHDEAAAGRPGPTTSAGYRLWTTGRPSTGWLRPLVPLTTPPAGASRRASPRGWIRSRRRSPGIRTACPVAGPVAATARARRRPW